MAKRPTIQGSGSKDPSLARFFSSGKHTFFSTGCSLLDCALGGGWARDRVINVVGDSSTGKTLLAIEAAANFSRQYPDGEIRYNEAESCFDKEYATAIGLPITKVQFVADEREDEGLPPCETVEDLIEDVTSFLKDRKSSSPPAFYVIDSMDALTDRAELERDLSAGTYGTNKARMLSQFFRVTVRQLARTHVTFFIVSQERDNIGVTFGRKSTRSGGRALQFYSCQVLWLANKGRISKTRKGVERPVGNKIIAKVDKNKAGLPYRQVEFPMLYTFGIDDVTAGAQWLMEVKRPQALGFKSLEELKKYIAGVPALSSAEYREEREQIAAAVTEAWPEVESEFMPKAKKYE